MISEKQIKELVSEFESLAVAFDEKLLQSNSATEILKHQSDKASLLYRLLGRLDAMADLSLLERQSDSEFQLQIAALD